jgi:hypothetical protein
MVSAQDHPRSFLYCRGKSLSNSAAVLDPIALVTWAEATHACARLVVDSHDSLGRLVDCGYLLRNRTIELAVRHNRGIRKKPFIR